MFDEIDRAQQPHIKTNSQRFVAALLLLSLSGWIFGVVSGQDEWRIGSLSVAFCLWSIYIGNQTAQRFPAYRHMAQLILATTLGIFIGIAGVTFALGIPRAWVLMAVLVSLCGGLGIGWSLRRHPQVPAEARVTD